jgi:ABC-type bacteriocin/lantibiotic exporter with double-glycine peptidase domain
MDEGTNGLDAETRDRIVANLRELYRDRLLIFLTHDKDVISQVDEVVTLEKSKLPGADDSYVPVVEQGQRQRSSL